MDRPLSRRKLQQRNRLATAHLALVPPIAARYAVNSPEPFDDLLQVGMLGLLRAAERYSSQNPVPFESYARPHIRGAILHQQDLQITQMPVALAKLSAGRSQEAALLHIAAKDAAWA